MQDKTVILSISLSIIGILTQYLFGLESAGSHLLFMLIGLSSYILLQKVERQILIRFSGPLSVIGAALLLLLLLAGDPTRGSRRWFFIFGFGLQPSVLAAPFFALFLSSVLVMSPVKNIWSFLRTLLVMAVPVALVFKQPDLGTALVLFLALFSVIFYSGVPVRHLLVLSGLSVPALWLFSRILKPYQLQRLASFLNPQLDPTGINYNSLQSVIAIGSGHLLGKGFLGASQSKLMFLPEANTDFVFAALTEAFGVLGALILLTVFFLFFSSLLADISSSRTDRLTKYYAVAVFSFFFIQFAFNVGMNLRLLPVVGVPLPFISQGGSSILASYIFLGIRKRLSDG